MTDPECELRDNDIESQCYSQCHAARDGDCYWPKCPQMVARQSHCPLDFLCTTHDKASP